MTLHVSVHFYLQLVLCSLAIRNQENYFTKLRLKKIQFLQRVSIEMFSQSPTLPYLREFDWRLKVFSSWEIVLLSIINHQRNSYQLPDWGVCECEVGLS